MGDTVTRRQPAARAEPVLRRRGGFYLPGDWDAAADRPVGSAWVQWEAPADEAEWRCPVILVHGGGGQSTDWMWAVDGQPGWAELFVRAGHPTYLVDRPGHGRSTYDPALMGARAEAPGAAVLAQVFRLDPSGLRAGGDAGPRPLIDSSTGLLVEADSAQRLDLACLARLLELTGPAVVVGHSAGAPGVWLAADRRPDLVRGVVAVEPLGPPHAGGRHARALAEGVTAVPLDAAAPGAGGRRGIARVPVLVVTAAASGHRDADRLTAGFLTAAGVDVEHLELERHGVRAGGHGVIFDQGSTAAFGPVHRWCAARDTESTSPSGGGREQL